MSRSVLVTRIASLIVVGVSAFSVSLAAQAPRTIRLTGNDSLRYTPATFTVKPGERLTIEMRTMSTQPAAQMSHNFVLLKPEANIDKFVLAAAKEKASEYMPASLKNEVLVATEMVAANAVAKATFTAPTKPGTYTFFCTFPGHYYGGMKGTLVVK